MTRQTLALVAVLAVSLLAVPAVASAASDAVRDGYGGLGRTESTITPGQSDPPAAQSSGTETSSQTTPVASTASTSSAGALPFTGLDLGLVAGAGVLLLGVGYGLRRMAGRPSERL